LGDAAPQGEILGARVEDLLAKEALIVDDAAIFTTPSVVDEGVLLGQEERRALEVDKPRLIRGESLVRALTSL
jgi:hypothetical protein